MYKTSKRSLERKNSTSTYIDHIAYQKRKTNSYKNVSAFFLDKMFLHVLDTRLLLHLVLSYKE